MSSSVGAQPGMPRSKVTGGRASTIISNEIASGSRPSASLNQAWMIPLPLGCADRPAGVRRVDAEVEAVHQRSNPRHLLGGHRRGQALLERRQLRLGGGGADVVGQRVERAVRRERGDPRLPVLHEVGRERGHRTAVAEDPRRDRGGAGRRRAQVVAR